MYDTAARRPKNFLSRVKASRDYKVHIAFDIDFQQFCREMETDLAEITEQQTARFISETGRCKLVETVRSEPTTS